MENSITYEDFRNKVLSEVEKAPKEWRKGQAVFNIIDSQYGVARTVQFGNGVDCFYNDDVIEEFMLLAYRNLIEGR